MSLSLFASDTLDLFYIDPNGKKRPISLTKKGIAWWTDKHVKFRNPGGSNSNLTAVFKGRVNILLYIVLYRGVYVL